MIEAMKQALEALEFAIDQLAKPYSTQAQYAITSLRQAIEQAEKQEPVALQMDVIVVNLVREGINKHRARELAEHFIKHTAPQPQREWVGTVDCIGLALDLEAQAKRVESQTVERAMLAAANGLRIIDKESKA